jgi:phage terminase large subunit
MPRRSKYENLKAQCTYMLAEAVNRHRVAISLEDVELPADMTLAELKEMIVADLEQMKRKDADKDGKLKIMPKD